MKIDVLTLFPEVFKLLDNYSIVGRALGEGKLEEIGRASCRETV